MRVSQQRGDVRARVASILMSKLDDDNGCQGNNEKHRRRLPLDQPPPQRLVDARLLNDYSLDGSNECGGGTDYLRQTSNG